MRTKKGVFIASTNRTKWINSGKLVEIKLSYFVLQLGNMSILLGFVQKRVNVVWIEAINKNLTMVLTRRLR